MALFMEECLLEESGAMSRTSTLYERFMRWCEDNGFHAENMRNFRSLLAGYGQIERHRPNPNEEKTTVLMGYRIRDQATPLGSTCESGAVGADQYITPIEKNIELIYFAAPFAPTFLLLICR